MDEYRFSLFTIPNARNILLSIYVYEFQFISWSILC